MKCQYSDLQKCGFRMGGGAKINVSSFCKQQWKLTKNTLENPSKNLQKSIPEAFQKHIAKSNVKKTEKKRSKSGKWSPKGAGIGGEKLYVFILFRFREPRWPQDPPRDPQGTPTRIFNAFSMIFDWFFRDFLLILFSFFINFRLSTKIHITTDKTKLRALPPSRRGQWCSTRRQSTDPKRGGSCGPKALDMIYQPTSKASSVWDSPRLVN